MASHGETSPTPPGDRLDPYQGEIQLRTSFLERYFDPALVPLADFDRERLILGESVRIVRFLTPVIIAGRIPRRLGGEATSEELALDKKRGRRAAHALRQSHVSWTKDEPVIELNDLTKRTGAQLEWDPWSRDHALSVMRSLRTLSTWAIINDDRRWGRSAVVYLENELRWITYALRD